MSRYLQRKVVVTLKSLYSKDPGIRSYCSHDILRHMDEIMPIKSGTRSQIKWILGNACLRGILKKNREGLFSLVDDRLDSDRSTRGRRKSEAGMDLRSCKSRRQKAKYEDTLFCRHCKLNTAIGNPSSADVDISKPSTSNQSEEQAHSSKGDICFDTNVKNLNDQTKQSKLPGGSNEPAYDPHSQTRGLSNAQEVVKKHAKRVDGDNEMPDEILSENLDDNLQKEAMDDLYR